VTTNRVGDIIINDFNVVEYGRLLDSLVDNKGELLDMLNRFPVEIEVADLHVFVCNTVEVDDLILTLSNKIVKYYTIRDMGWKPR
jgi:hypothetical protein